MTRTSAGSIICKSIPMGLVDRGEQPDGDYQDIGMGWLCNVTWDQLQPTSQGQGLQGSKTLIGTLNTTFVKNSFVPALRTTNITLDGSFATNFPNGIVSNRFNGILLDDLVGHTQFIVLNGNLAPAAATISLNDVLPNFGYAIGTNIYYLTGTAWIDAALAWATLKPVRWVDLNVLCGRFAPTWAKQIQPASAPVLTDGITGAFPYYEHDLNGSTLGSIPALWNNEGRVVIKDLFNKLGARYDSSPYLRTVRCSGGGSMFGEPSLRHIGGGPSPSKVNAATCTSLLLSGYTEAADILMLQNYMDDIKVSFPTTPITYSFNAQQVVRPETRGPFNVSSIGAGVINYTGLDLSPTRTVADGVTTINSTTITSATANFGAPDVLVPITGTNIPNGAYIVSVTNATTAIMSHLATASGSGISITIGFAWASTNSAVWFLLYAGRISFSAANPAGGVNPTIQDNAGASNTLNATWANNSSFYISGTYYPITAISTINGTVTITGTLDAGQVADGDLRGMPYFIVPFNSDATNQFPITGATSAPRLNITGTPGAIPTGTKVVALRILNSDEPTTVTLMTSFRAKLGARGILGNSSVAADNSKNSSLGAWGNQAPYADIVTQGSSIYMQTNADAGINGSTTNSLLGLFPPGPITIKNCIDMGSRFIELPKAYCKYMTFTISSASGNTLTATASQQWGANTWNGGPGTWSYVVVANSTHLYYCIANGTSSTLKVCGTSVIDSTQQNSATLSSDLSTGGAITSIAINTLGGTVDIPSGANILIYDPISQSSQAWTTTSLTTHAVSTTIAVSSQTPNFAYPKASSTIYYCPPLTTETGTATVYHWDYQSVTQMQAICNQCQNGVSTTLGRYIAV